jgi:tetratricopeptide (TPR) repeat protein
MKKTLLLILFGFSLAGVKAQAPQVDSLTRLLATTKEDTIKVMVLAKLCFYDQNFRHGLDLAQEGLALARKIKYEKGEAACIIRMGSQYSWISNFPMALHYFLEALKISERIGDKEGLATAYYDIGMVYKTQSDFQNALNYFKKSAPFFSNDNYYRLACLNTDFGDVYALLDKQDSALKYYQRSYELFTLSKDKYQFIFTLIGLGDVQLKMGNRELAMGYYREAIQNGISYNDSLGLSSVYLRIARLYDAAGEKDSCKIYAERTFLYAQRVNVLQNIIESGKLLSKLYENENDQKALRYLQIALEANDSLFSRERTLQIQNMSLAETVREKEMEDKKEQDAAERKINIQYVLIALGIVTFLILFLLLSHSIIVTEKWISFFGILSLLIVFEFINLVLHPHIERITDHSPLLMLLALVLLASILIPLHHRIEKWVKEKMTEKNKKIRLANAKKTIAKLEPIDKKIN